MAAVVRVPWRRADEQLMQDRAETPPVDRGAVAELVQHLGRDILGRATDRARALGRAAYACLGEPEVAEPHVAVAVEQNVLRLEVAVDGAVRVQELERERCLRTRERLPRAMVPRERVRDEETKINASRS